MENRSLLRRILFRITIPFWIAVIWALWLIDIAASLLDHGLQTQFRKPKISEEEVEGLLETYVHPGSTIIETLAFLELFDLPHSEIVTSENFVSRTFTPKDDELLEYKKRSKAYMVAWVKNVGRSLLFTDDIRIIFFFDEQSNLVAYTIDLFSTGL